VPTGYLRDCPKTEHSFDARGLSWRAFGGPLSRNRIPRPAGVLHEGEQKRAAFSERLSSLLVVFVINRWNPPSPQRLQTLQRRNLAGRFDIRGL
jgi:hypothetical protein